MKKNILVIDDSKLILYALQRLLESADKDYNIHEADSGKKALDFLDKNKPDIIILDLMMPGISGVDVFKKIKNDEKTKDIPVLILTADTDALRWEKELKSCDKFIIKPFNNDELVNEVKKLLNKGAS